MSVSDDFARKIGLSAGAPAIFNTAAGRAVGRIVPEATVQVGGIRVDGIRIGAGTGEHALLGANFLSRVQLMQDGDRLVLRASGTP